MEEKVDEALQARETPRDRGLSRGQRSLACCSPWGLKESDTTERLNNSNNSWERVRPFLRSEWPQEELDLDRRDLRVWNSRSMGESLFNYSRELHTYTLLAVYMFLL